MDVERELTIRFAADGNSLAFLGGGWARAEPEFTWTVGAESHVILPPAKLPGDYILTLDVIPFIHRPQLQKQRLTISINETAVGSAELSRPTLLGYRVPAGLVSQSDRMLVTLRHPDATRPNAFADSHDARDLAFAVSEATLYRVLDAPQAAPLPAGLTLGSRDRHTLGATLEQALTEWATERTGLALRDIAMKFESIGENCEFGLFQRRCDAEPLGLLRFSSTFMRNLVRGIENGFEGLGEIDDIEPRLEGGPPREYMIHEKKYGLVYQTFVYEGERSVWMVREQEAARLKFLRRKFLEDLQSTEKIFIYRFDGPISEEEILPLQMALCRYGPATLLWVLPADSDMPVGSVEVGQSGLLKGYIDRFAPSGNAHDFSFDGWLRLCVNACVLDRLQKSTAVSRNAANSISEGSC
jgi:hypothetical protein